MGKPGVTKMVNLGPKQKYGLKMDHGAKQMSKTDKGINYMMGAATKQMSNPPFTMSKKDLDLKSNSAQFDSEFTQSNYGETKRRSGGVGYGPTGMHSNTSSQKENKEDLSGTKTNLGLQKKNCGYGAKQMKTGLYQDRMDGKLPQNPMLMQYGMSEKAVKQVGKHIAMPQIAEEGEPLKPASSVGSPSEAARKSKADALSEGYKTQSIKTKDNVRSTVMALDVPKPKTSVVEAEEPSKQYAGTYVKRKFLPGYKSVSSESAKEAYKAQKRKGRLTKYENVDKKADRG